MFLFSTSNFIQNNRNPRRAEGTLLIKTEGSQAGQWGRLGRESASPGNLTSGSEKVSCPVLRCPGVSTVSTAVFGIALLDPDITGELEVLASSLDCLAKNEIT